jgi:Rps23 Pro-64 3,4-dihydroxylase Tpa1-like proline 4-hydroxylase
MLPLFKDAIKSAQPFPHLRVSEILRHEDADQVLRWLREKAPWKLTVTDFYEQYEFSLLDSTRAPGAERLVELSFIKTICTELKRIFEVEEELDLVDVTAHKLTPGQTIRIHNDFLGLDETHRLLIQFNAGWEVSQGGLLMLFGADTPETLQTVLLPTHGSGFAFEISAKSFHAVSSIKAGERYTLVYTFRRRA